MNPSTCTSCGVGPRASFRIDHAPLFHILYAPLLAALGERVDIVPLMRLAVMPWYLLTLWLAWLLGLLLGAALVLSERLGRETMMDAQCIAEVLEHARRDDIRAFPSLKSMWPTQLINDGLDPCQVAGAQTQQRLTQARYALLDVCHQSALAIRNVYL